MTGTPNDFLRINPMIPSPGDGAGGIEMKIIFLFIVGYFVGYFSCIANKNDSPSKIWTDYIIENEMGNMKDRENETE